MADLHESFSSAYADAVVGFIRTRRAHGVDLDRASGRFVAGQLEAGTAPTDVEVWVSENWRSFVAGLTGPAKLPPDSSVMELVTELMLRLRSSPKVRELANKLASE